MEFETIFALISFAALVIVWALAPTKAPAVATEMAPAVKPSEVLA
jgi:hypothetical protein